MTEIETANHPDLSRTLNLYRLSEIEVAKPVCSNHIEKISRTRAIQWERLPPYLGIDNPETVVNDIVHEVTDMERRRAKLFSRWRSEKGSNANYKCLINALLEINSVDDAQYVCGLLMPQEPQISMPKRKLLPIIKNDAIDLNKVDGSELSLDKDFGDVKYALRDLKAQWQQVSVNIHLDEKTVKSILRKHPNNDSQCLCDAIRRWLNKKYDHKGHGCPSWRMLVEAVVTVDQATASEIANAHKAIEKAITMLDDKFKDLTYKICDIIMKRVGIENLQITLAIYLMDEDKPGKAKFMDEKTLTDILKSVVSDGNHYNFLNYTLLEILVKKFGNKTIKQSTENYKKELKQFRQETLLCDFKEFFKKEVILSDEDLERLSVKVKRDYKTFTLEYMELLKSNITHKLFLPSFSMMLRDIKPGCIEIVWFIPIVFANVLIKLMKKENLVKFCTQNMLTNIYIGNECAYSVIGGYSKFLKNIYEKIEEVQGLVPVSAQLFGVSKTVTEHQIGVCAEGSGEQPRLILIEGTAPGNTTFSKYCCHKWSQGQLFGHLDLLVRLQLSESKINSAKSLKDLFHHPNSKFQQYLMEEVENRKGKGMALWLDGWDELSKERRSKSIFTDLLCGDLLPQAQIFVTSQPLLAQELEMSSDVKVDQHILIKYPERDEDREEIYRTTQIQADYSEERDNRGGGREAHYWRGIPNRLQNRCTASESCCIRAACFMALYMILFFTTGILLFILQNSSVSHLEIGNSDFVLLSRSVSSEITICIVTDSTTIQIFYLNQCSVDTQQLNFSETLNMLTANEFHRIDEPYLVNGSQLQYTFSTPETNVSSPCAALVYIFQNLTSYIDFATNNIVINAITTCLPSNSSIHITVSAEDGNQYYFIGLINFIPEITIHYTVTGKLLSYNVTGLSPIITCSLTTSSPDCSVPLQEFPPSEDACIVGTLQLATNNFTTIVVNTSFNRTTSIGFGSYNMAISGLLFIVILLITFIVIIRKLRR